MSEIKHKYKVGETVVTTDNEIVTIKEHAVSLVDNCEIPSYWVLFSKKILPDGYARNLLESSIDVNKTKKHLIYNYVYDALVEDHKQNIKSIDKALNSGTIDIDSWDESVNPMILPRCIITAILSNASKKYLALGTSFEKVIKRESKNIEIYL